MRPRGRRCPCRRGLRPGLLRGSRRVCASSRSWSSSCLLSSCDLGMEGVEPVLPEPAVLNQPLVDLDERLRAECVDPALRVLAYVDQPGFPQHTKMTGHARASDRESLGQLTCTRRVVAENLENRAPALVCQRVQHGVHGANVAIWVRIRKVTFAPVEKCRVWEVQK